MSYCTIAPGHPDHQPYHDNEYGFPTTDETALFERLVLEINQSRAFMADDFAQARKFPRGLQQLRG